MEYKLKCSVCGEYFTSIDEIEDHIERTHPEEMEAYGLVNCYQIISQREMEAQTETFRQLERSLVNLAMGVTKYPKGKPIKYKGERYYPYYKDVYKTKGKDLFLCLQHKFVTESAREMISHILKEHGSQEEADEFGKLWVSEKLLDRIRNKYGSTEHLSKEDLMRLAEQELRDIMMYEELTSKNKPERLKGYVSEGMLRIEEFLSKKTDVCPSCNLLLSSVFLGKDCEIQKILDSIGMKGTKAYAKLSKGEIGFLEALKGVGVNAEYKGKDLTIDFARLVHLSLDHPEQFKRLINSGQLKIKNSKIQNYLLSQGWKKGKKVRITLSDFEIPKTEDKLNWIQKEYLKWLKGKRD